MESRNKLTMCRLCLCENECFINIFERNDWQGYVAAEVISDLLRFQVSDTDRYPHVVCLTCLTKLTDFRQFKECCQNSKVTYDKMFVSRESLEEDKPEAVEIVTVKAEPIYYSDSEDNVSKASNDLDDTAGVAFKGEPTKDIVDNVGGSEYCEEEPFGEAQSDVQLALGDAVSHPQYPHCSGHKTPHCASKSGVDADSFAWTTNANDKPIFEKSKYVSLSEDVEASSSTTMERLEGKWIFPGERMNVAPLFQEGVSIGEECGRERKKTGGEMEGGSGTCPEKGVREGRKVLECSYCGKVLMTKHGLVGHLKLHGFGQTFDCDICGKAFQNKSNLENHIRSHTGSRPYKCTECSKSYRLNHHLVIHMRSHTGYKPYKCEVCHNSFSVNNSLKIHMRTHTGYKPYKCTECSESFSYKSALTAHVQSHTDFKPFKCTECDEVFSANSALKIHMRLHSGSKAYKCETCSMGFDRISRLRRHNLVHTKEKPHECYSCSKQFSRREHLKRHIETNCKGKRE